MSSHLIMNSPSKVVSCKTLSPVTQVTKSEVRNGHDQPDLLLNCRVSRMSENTFLLTGSGRAVNMMVAC